MNSDAVLNCFKAGASMGDLASALGVDRALIEQMVRETLDRPFARATPQPPLLRLSPAELVGVSMTPQRPASPGGDPLAGRQAGRQAVSRGRRRSRDQIREGTLTALAHGPLNCADLMRTTRTAPSVMIRLLRQLVETGEVKQEGRLWRRIT